MKMVDLVKDGQLVRRWYLRKTHPLLLPACVVFPLLAYTPLPTTPRVRLSSPLVIALPVLFHPSPLIDMPALPI